MAREIKTGEVRWTKPVIKKGRFVGVKTRQPDPKAWKSLADKSARESKMHLLNFFMIVGFHMTSRNGQCVGDKANPTRL